MQGAFTTSVSTGWIHAIHFQLRVLSGDIIGTRRGSQKVPIQWQVMSEQSFIDISNRQQPTEHAAAPTSPRRDQAEINIKGGSGGGASQEY